MSEEVTPSALCISGEKWIAGDMGHPEMHPGRDCVGCHVEHDGPPLALGGTVYPVNTQEVDCYGVPGVTLEITTADNLVYTLESNAAGNFYLEGDPSTVAKPLSVVMHGWDVNGTPKDFMMTIQPETGDCGHCHGRNGDPVTDLTRNFPTFNISLQHAVEAYGFTNSPPPAATP